MDGCPARGPPCAAWRGRGGNARSPLEQTCLAAAHFTGRRTLCPDVICGPRLGQIGFPWPDIRQSARSPIGLRRALAAHLLAHNSTPHRVQGRRCARSPPSLFGAGRTDLKCCCRLSFSGGTRGADSTPPSARGKGYDGLHDSRESSRSFPCHNHRPETTLE
ncbi:hypothetical protein MRX96_007059 [Rhipicephalus microplus]